MHPATLPNNQRQLLSHRKVCPLCRLVGGVDKHVVEEQNVPAGDADAQVCAHSWAPTSCRQAQQQVTYNRASRSMKMHEALGGRMYVRRRQE